MPADDAHDAALCAYALDREGGQTPCTAADVKHPIGGANVKQRDRLLAIKPERGGRWYSQFLGRSHPGLRADRLGPPRGGSPSKLAPLCVTRWRISGLMMRFKT